MGKIERNGKRKDREHLLKKRIPELGYYLIVTDTKETERNYFQRLYESIPEKLKDKIVIKVSESETENLVETACSFASGSSQYRQPWIVFDRDRVINFDKIIEEAQKKEISVGWSNPCIEIWFSAYFGDMPTDQESTKCCDKFTLIYKKKTGQIYKKSNEKIYYKLCQYGDEMKAIKIAQKKLEEHERNCKNKPSEKCPGTTVHQLVYEIRSKLE